MVKDEKGFTIIELVVAIAIFALTSGVILHSFTMSTKLNRQAYDVDQANALAISTLESFKNECSTKKELKDKDNHNYVKYYDNDWNEITDAKNVKNAKFTLKVKMEKKKSQSELTGITPKTYMADKHQHIITRDNKTTLLLVHPNDKYGGDYGDREYKVLSLATWNNKRNIWDEFKRRAPNGSIEKGKVSEKLAAIQGSMATNMDINMYGVGSRVVGSPNDESVIADAVDENNIKDTIPIRMYLLDKENHTSDDYNIQIVNLTNKQVELYIEYLPCEGETYKYSLDKIKVTVISDSVGGLTSGPVNYVKRYGVQQITNEKFDIGVEITRNEDNHLMVEEHEEKYTRLQREK